MGLIENTCCVVVAIRIFIADPPHLVYKLCLGRLTALIASNTISDRNAPDLRRLINLLCS